MDQIQAVNVVDENGAKLSCGVDEKLIANGTALAMNGTDVDFGALNELLNGDERICELLNTGFRSNAQTEMYDTGSATAMKLNDSAEKKSSMNSDVEKEEAYLKRILLDKLHTFIETTTADLRTRLNDKEAVINGLQLQVSSLQGTMVSANKTNVGPLKPFPKTPASFPKCRPTSAVQATTPTGPKPKRTVDVPTKLAFQSSKWTMAFESRLNRPSRSVANSKNTSPIDNNYSSLPVNCETLRVKSTQAPRISRSVTRSSSMREKNTSNLNVNLATPASTLTRSRSMRIKAATEGGALPRCSSRIEELARPRVKATDSAPALPPRSKTPIERQKVNLMSMSMRADKESGNTSESNSTDLGQSTALKQLKKLQFDHEKLRLECARLKLMGDSREGCEDSSLTELGASDMCVVSESKVVKSLKLELLRLREEALEGEVKREALERDTEQAIDLLRKDLTAEKNRGNNLENQLLISQHSMQVLQTDLKECKQQVIDHQNESFLRERNHLLLIKQIKDAENDAREMKEFLSAERNTLSDSLQDAEGELQRLRNQLSEKRVQLEGLECELKRSSNRAKEFMVQQGAEISSTTVALTHLTRQIQTLLEHVNEDDRLIKIAVGKTDLIKQNGVGSNGVDHQVVSLGEQINTIIGLVAGLSSVLEDQGILNGRGTVESVDDDHVRNGSV